MQEPKKYDLVFSVGGTCACSLALRAAGLQHLSMPWDSIEFDLPNGGADLPLRLAIMESGFSDWMKEEDLDFMKDDTATGKAQYRNRRYNSVFPLDFPNGVPLNKSYPMVKDKYDRRVARFNCIVKEAKTCILSVYMDTPGTLPADIGTCQEAQMRLQALYPWVKVEFLMFSQEDGRTYSERKIEHVRDGFTRVSFDFKDNGSGQSNCHSVDVKQCASALRSLATVEGKAPTKARFRRTLREKMHEAGAANIWQYFLCRRINDLSHLKKALHPRLLFARLRRKKYDHVLSIGMNCEPAFRFSLSWGFVDSTPFSWAACRDPLCLAEALRHPELIGSEGFSFLENALMWRCEKTLINFHGKLVVKSGCALAPEALAADKDDLVQRLAYLNEKLTNILSDNSSKAIVYRISTTEALKPNANENINAVQQALEKRGACNYTLVVITEQSARGTIAPAPNRIVRTVKAFNPTNAVARPELGDSIGWQAIYTEFAPRKLRPKKYAFKFEQH